MGPSCSTEQSLRLQGKGALIASERVREDGEDDKQKRRVSLPEDNSLMGADDKVLFPACHLAPAASFRPAAGRRKPMGDLEHRAAVGTRGGFAEGFQVVVLIRVRSEPCN